jgi:GR25 family glycosyltransferase involved in LPS biosynthesis
MSETQVLLQSNESVPQQIKTAVPTIYYINLDRSTDRNSAIIEQFANLGIKDYKRITAVDGNNMNLRRYADWKVDINQSVLACTLSHIIAIKNAYYNNEDCAIIVEDDVILWPLLDNINMFNKTIKNLPTDCDILQLYSSNMHYNPCYYEGQRKWSIEYWCTAAYYITKTGMEKIMSCIREEDGKIILLSESAEEDWRIYVADQYLYNTCNTYVANFPYACSTLDPSTIHTEHDEGNFRHIKSTLDFLERVKSAQ